MKVRSINGYSMERISLYAINYPSIKLSTNNINIGYCSEGCSRDFSFYVSNLTSINISISILLKNTSANNRFIFPFVSDELQPYERKMFKGKFLPTKNDKGKQLENQILVMTGNGELLKININGICDESIKIYKTKIDFGPTDIYSHEISKILIIENIDKYNKIPVLMEPSTNEIIINDNKNIILNPSEIKKVKIKFLSYYSGDRSETIFVSCPFSNLKTIEVVAFSGPAVIFPVYKDIYLPIVKIDDITTLNVPLINMTPKQVSCILYMPVHNNPINLSIGKKTSTLDFKEYEDKNYKGIKIRFKNKETAIISIIFCSNLSGIFKIPLMLKVDKNNSIKLNNYFIYGAAYDGGLYEIKKLNFNKFLSFYHDKPSTLILTKYEQLNKNKLKITDNLKFSDNVSDIFEIKTNKININYNETYKNNNIKYINFFNKTEIPQKYYMTISEPFIIAIPSTPLEGVIEANTMINIPITINLELIENRYLVENDVTIFGVLTIYDDSITHNPLSVRIEGTINDVINIGIRSNISGILYPLFNEVSKISRNFILRNKSPYSVRCNIYLKKLDTKLEKIIARNPYLNKRIIAEIKGINERRSQFTQNIKTLVLEPYQASEVEISYSLLNIRGLNCGFFIEYFTSLTDDLNINSNDLKDIQNIENSKFIVLLGYTKPYNIKIYEGNIDFGCISEENDVTKYIKFSNENNDKYNLISYVSYPFSHEGQNIKNIEPNKSVEIPIKYLYRKVGPQHQSLIYNSDIRSFSCILIYGNVSICKADINLFTSKMIYNIDKNHYIIDKSSVDFGYLPYENKLIKTFYIKNNGSIDYIIEDINILKYKNDNNEYTYIIDKKNPNDNLLFWENDIDLNFKSENLDKYEYDMDEKIKKYKVIEQYRSNRNLEKLYTNGKLNENDNNDLTNEEKLDKSSIFPIFLKPNHKINIQLIITPKQIVNK